MSVPWVWISGLRQLHLDPSVNTGADETHASITADGKTLYFTSSRRGGLGGLDIYRSNRLPSGIWGEAENLGAKINTPEDEETPFLADDGKRLYFSSKGHFNMGGQDVFFSPVTETGNWKDPVNIGFPINTTGDDLFYYPIGDGSQGFISRIERDEAHAFNIYHVSIGERKVEFSDSSGPLEFPDDFSLHILKAGSSDTLSIQYRKDKNLFESSDPSYKIIRENK